MEFGARETENCVPGEIGSKIVTLYPGYAIGAVLAKHHSGLADVQIAAI